MYNKRGQGLSTNAIILIVLGVVVLAVLVIGFTMGWDKIAPWISTSNVDTIKTQCSVACATGSTYDYCTLERTLKDGKNKITGTCEDFAKLTYGIEDCSAELCSPPKTCLELGGTWVAPTQSAECPPVIPYTNDGVKVDSSDSQTGKNCCIYLS